MYQTSKQFSSIFSIRNYQYTDLEQFKWAGSDIYFSSWQWAVNRKELGEIDMLVVDLGGYPVGRIWVDYKPAGGLAGRGTIWSLNVHPILQNHGIGAWLIEVGEYLLTEKGMTQFEIRVDKSNVRARQLYERLGYRIVSEKQEVLRYVTMSGKTNIVDQNCWILQKQTSPKNLLAD